MATAKVKSAKSRKKSRVKTERPNTVILNYTFRAYSPNKAQLVLDQMLGKRKFYNRLVEIHNECKELFDTRIRSLSAEYDRDALEVDRCKERLDSAYLSVRKSRAKARERIDPTPEQSDEIEAAWVELKNAWLRCKDSKSAAMELHKESVAPYRAEYDAKVESALEKYNLANSVDRASLPPLLTSPLKCEYMDRLLSLGIGGGDPERYFAVRDARESRACYSGSGGQAEESFSAALRDTNFANAKKHHWDNDEYVSIQIASCSQRPISETCDGKSSNLKLIIPHLDMLQDKGSLYGKLARGVVRMKLGNTNDSWIEFSTVFHRALPMDGVIVWAHLHRRAIGTKIEWELRLTIRKREKPVIEAESRATVSVHLGFRNLGDVVRAATWLDQTADSHVESDDILSTDRYAEEGHADLGRAGQLMFSQRLLDEVKSVSDIESARKLRFNEIIRNLRDFIDEGDVPDWLLDKTEFIHLWKSQKQLAILTSNWQRFKRDEVIYNQLGEWLQWDTIHYNRARKRDKRFRRHRKDCYRRFAKRLSEKFAFCCLPDINWAELNRRPGVLDEYTPEAMRRMASFVACGQLRECIVEAFGKHRIKLVDANGITMICSSCGHKQSVVIKKGIHRCEHCACEYDIDVNALVNQNIRSVGVASGAVTEK